MSLDVLRLQVLLISLEDMVWPPPRIQAPSPEGEAPADQASLDVGAPRSPSQPPPRRSSPPAQPPPRRSSPPAAPVQPPPQRQSPPAAPATSSALGAASPARAPQFTPPPDTATHVAHDWLSRPEALIGTVLGGRYRITSLLGRGAMGIACEGESSRGRHVTLKLLPRPTDLPVEHFAWQVRQTLALAHFDHPNVSPINDFGALEDGSAFVSRSRVPGITLRTMLRQGPLPVRRALELGRQIAAALAAAHGQDIAHGRLKPENVLVQTQPGAGDRVKVVDFGMAELPVNVRAVAPDENDARRLMLRTRLYLPRGANPSASAAVDVYSLGVILFEMIAGQPPFVFEALGAAGPEAPPISFAQCQPPIHVPTAISDLVMSTLHPRAAQQGVSASHLVQVLDALLGRPSSPPADAEPVTSERASLSPPAGAVSLEPPPPTVKGPPPEFQGQAGASFLPPAAHAGNNIVPSWPPLPRGFSSSSVPPPPTDYDPNQPSFPSTGAPAGAHSSGAFPPVISAADAAASTPPGVASSLPPRSSLELDPGDEEAEFRPSLLGRLRRLFDRSKRGDGF